MSYTLHLGDCLEVMPGIPAGSVDAIIADWPYGTTACKWDSVIPLEPLWKECKRVIKKNGAIALTAAQPFTSVLVMSNLNWFKYDWVWRKTRGSGHLNVKKRPMVSHESVLVFSENGIGYYPQMSQGRPYTISRRSNKTGSQYGKHKAVSGSYDGQRYPTSVLTFSSGANGHKLHPNEKPVALMEYLIKTYTNPGDLVLDNTFGSCSTGEACLRTGRRFIGIEKDKGYFEIGQERMERVEQELREAQIAKERQPYLIAEVAA